MTGVSRSMLAQIEKGDVNPTISVLWKIANGYRVSFTSLVETAPAAPVLLRGRTRRPWRRTGAGTVNYPAFPFDEEPAVRDLPHRHPARRSAWRPSPICRGPRSISPSLPGQVEIGAAGGDLSAWAPGDSLRFPADQPHRYRNPGAEEAQLSMLIWYRG